MSIWPDIYLQIDAAALVSNHKYWTNKDKCAEHTLSVSLSRGRGRSGEKGSDTEMESTYPLLTKYQYHW